MFESSSKYHKPQRNGVSQTSLPAPLSAYRKDSSNSPSFKTGRLSTKLQHHALQQGR